MDVDEEKVRGSVTYFKNITSRRNLFKIFNENNTMNLVTDTKIVCGNDSINNYDYQSVIHCKKDKSDLEEIPIILVDIHNAFDLMHSKGLQLYPSETENVIYQQGKYSEIFILPSVLNVFTQIFELLTNKITL